MMKQKDNIIKIELPTPFPVGTVNVYLLEEEKLTLIDAGIKTEEAWKVFQESLKAKGYQVKDIEQIILTHQHPDHVGFLNWFSNDIPIYGHKSLEPWVFQNPIFVEQYEILYKNLLIEFGIQENIHKWLDKSTLDIKKYSPKGKKLTGYLKEGDILPYASEWEVIETPGHSRSQLMFYNRKKKIAFGGDHILPNVPSNPYLEPTVDYPKSNPLLDYLQSLEKVLNYDIDLIYPGHGDPIRNIHRLILQRLEKQKKWASKVLKTMGEGPKTTFQVCDSFFPKTLYVLPDYIFSEIFCQLNYLELQGLVKQCKDKNGVIHWENIHALNYQ